MRPDNLERIYTIAAGNLAHIAPHYVIRRVCSRHAPIELDKHLLTRGGRKQPILAHLKAEPSRPCLCIGN